MYIHILAQHLKCFQSTWSWPQWPSGFPMAHPGAGCHRLRTDAGLSAGHGRGQGPAGDPLQRPRGFGRQGTPWDAENFWGSFWASDFSRDFLFGWGCFDGFLEPIICCVYFSIQILEWSIGVWMPPWLQCDVRSAMSASIFWRGGLSFRCQQFRCPQLDPYKMVRTILS